jgi:hypothetical protein
MRRIAFVVASSGCVASPPDLHEGPAPLVTPHFELYGAMPSQAAWYEAFAVELEAWRGEPVPAVRLFQNTWPLCPSTSCNDDGKVTVVCSATDNDCLPAIAGALTDHFGVMPLVFRHGLVDVLAGGLGHGDLLDVAIDRAIALPELVDDAEYTRRQATTNALAWAGGVQRPAGDFVRFVVDALGAAGATQAFYGGAWGELGSLQLAIERWRAMPPTIGRMYRLPLVECSAERRINTGSTLVPAMAERVQYAPDVVDPMHRVAIGNFQVEAASAITITVTSAIHAPPFFRVESCGGADPGRFVGSYADARGDIITSTMELPAGTYFVVGGSSGGDSSTDPTAADRPENIAITAVKR